MLNELRKLEVEVITESVEVWLTSLKLQPTLLDRIKEAQKKDPKSKALLKLIKSRQKTQLWEDEQGAIGSIPGCGFQIAKI